MFALARGGQFVFDQHTRPQKDYITPDCELVKLENAPDYVERFDLHMGRLRVRDKRVEDLDLVADILDFYAEDLELYERGH